MPLLIGLFAMPEQAIGWQWVRATEFQLCGWQPNEPASKPRQRSSKVKRMIVVALAVLGVCMAATSSASSHEFHATLLGGELLGSAFNGSIQKFVPFSGGGAVECKKATTTGLVAALLGLHQLVSVFYSECTAFGVTKVHISTAKYLLSADGLAAIENTILINVLSPGNCTITVHPQDLGTVLYTTKGTELIEKSEVTGIASLGSGGLCGTADNLGGTYTGENLIIEDGGSLGWS
jgi:hypothetical protein